MSTAYPDIQATHNGPLTDEAIGRFFKIREDNSYSYLEIGKFIGFSQAFTYNLMNKKANFDSKHVGKIAKGLEIAEAGQAPGIAEASASSSLKHLFHLRPGIQVELELPSDLSGKEAGRLAQFVQSLPVE